jgi:hypothetical protein
MEWSWEGHPISTGRTTPHWWTHERDCAVFAHRKRHDLRGPGDLGRLCAGVAHHALLAAGGLLLRTQLGAISSVAAGQSLVWPVHQELSAGSVNSASGQNHNACRTVAGAQLHGLDHRTSLVGQAPAAVNRHWRHHTPTLDQHSPTGEWDTDANEFTFA